MAKKSETTSQYETLTRIRHDGDYYEKGSVIELTDAQAAPLLEGKAVKPFLGAPEGQKTTQNQDEGGEGQ